MSLHLPPGPPGPGRRTNHHPSLGGRHLHLQPALRGSVLPPHGKGETIGGRPKLAPLASHALVVLLAAAAAPAARRRRPRRPRSSPHRVPARSRSRMRSPPHTTIDHQPASADLGALTGSSNPLLRTAAPRLDPLASTDDPAQLLAAVSSTTRTSRRSRREQPLPADQARRSRGRPFPTQVVQGFFYRTPARLDSNFADAPASDPAAAATPEQHAQESVFAFPNRLNLDDRVPL